jgi:hypothetical protein
LENIKINCTGTRIVISYTNKGSTNYIYKKNNNDIAEKYRQQEINTYAMHWVSLKTLGVIKNENSLLNSQPESAPNTPPP